MNVVLVGVGGQGILTSSLILAKAAMKAGLNVLSSEVHGMAQRGGSVEVHVRIGSYRSPLIPPGCADVMLALEPVEAIRYSKYLNERSAVVVNTRVVKPITVIMGKASYPDVELILEKIKGITDRVYPIDASRIADELGSPQSANVVMLGAMLKVVEMPFGMDKLEEALKDVLPKKIWEINIKALWSGFNAI